MTIEAAKSAWLLIYWISMGSMGSFGGLHAATGVAQFADEASCHAAYQAMRQVKSDSQGVWGVCVPQRQMVEP